MKINKGIIRNVNARAIALTLSSVLVLTSLTGCVSISDVKYLRDEEGYINAIDGYVQYDTLEYCYFAKVNNNIKGDTYYTIVLIEDKMIYGHYDLFTRQKLNANGFEIEFLDAVCDYINAFAMSKDEYTEEELTELLNIFIEKQEKDKRLVKE